MDYSTYQYNPELAYPVEVAEEEAQRGRSRSRTPPPAAEEVTTEEELPQDASVPLATPARNESTPLRRGRGRPRLHRALHAAIWQSVALETEHASSNGDKELIGDVLKKIHAAMTSPLMIVWPTSACGQAIARMDSPYQTTLALCRTGPQKMMTPMPHLHAADAPFRMAWLWRGVEERHA